jgi:hypothetical protein
MGVEAKDLKIGGQYLLEHQRFGQATVRVLWVCKDAEWVDVEVEGGELVGCDFVAGVGDVKRVRSWHSVFLVTG